MANCPACCESMSRVRVDPIEIDACSHCGGFWFGRSELETLTSAQTVRSVLDAAHGKPGRCRGCNQSVSEPGPCPKCDREAPACPACSRAPLAIGNVKGVNLDVCPRCGGVWFDAGELQLVAGHGSAVQKLQQGAFKVTDRNEAERPRKWVHCSACAKSLLEINAFAKDDALFCGTCCPAGASPVVAILTPKDPTLIDEGHALRHAQRNQVASYAALRTLLRFLG